MRRRTTGRQRSSLRAPCGTWSNSYAIISRSQRDENIPMKECFGVFSRVAEFASPMSRRQIVEKREFSLPSLGADRHIKHVILDPSLLTGSCRRVGPDCGGGEPLQGWTRDGVHTQAAKQMDQRADASDSEFVVSNSLFARMLLRHIRSFNRAVVENEKQSGAFCEAKAGRMSDSSPDVGLSIRRQSQCPPAIRQSLVSDPPLAPIETLFTELARRRLRSPIAKEKPS